MSALAAGEDADRRKAFLLLVGMGCLHALLFLLAYGLLSSTPLANEIGRAHV